MSPIINTDDSFSVFQEIQALGVYQYSINKC